MVDVCGKNKIKNLQAQKNRLEWFKNQLHACSIVCDVKKSFVDFLWMKKKYINNVVKKKCKNG